MLLLPACLLDPQAGQQPQGYVETGQIHLSDGDEAGGSLSHCMTALGMVRSRGGLTHN